MGARSPRAASRRAPVVATCLARPRTDLSMAAVKQLSSTRSRAWPSALRPAPELWTPSALIASAPRSAPKLRDCLLRPRLAEVAAGAQAREPFAVLSAPQAWTTTRARVAPASLRRLAEFLGRAFEPGERVVREPSSGWASRLFVWHRALPPRCEWDALPRAACSQRAPRPPAEPQGWMQPARPKVTK